METYRDTISQKFKDIKNQFGYMTNNTNKKGLKKNNSHLNLVNRPKLPKTKHKSIDKTDLGNILDQIGNDDLIFNNDKLITNIKIESFENALKKNSIISIDNDKSFISKKTNKTNKTNSTSLNHRKNNRQKNNLSQKKDKIKDYALVNNTNNSLELNCNKISFVNGNNKKKQNTKNTKKNKSLNKNKNICVKNVDQFINKPNDNKRISNKTITMTPISNKTTTNRILKKNNLLKNNEFHSSQRSFLHFNNNDSISLASTSRLDISKVIRGRSMPTMRSNKSLSNLRFPNKSIIKNQDKVMIELQKLFGDKIQLNEDIYQNMTELDKKNCINFLLEAVKELNNINKINKSKTDGYKEIIENKENDIKNLKNEIKELKKENMKLNKLIKTNNQLNKKLSQNIDNLKLQLEKEKNKNKNLKTKGKSTSKMNNIYSNKYRKETSINKNKRNKEVKSQDKIKKVSGFINRKKSDNSNEEQLNNLNNNDLKENNNIHVKDEVNISLKNKEENKTDISPNSLISNESKEKNGVNNNINNIVNE